MNELVKAQLDDGWFRRHVADDGLERAARCLSRRRRQFPNYDGLNFSRGLLDPVNAIIKLVGEDVSGRPAGSNWGHYENPETEALIEQIFTEFDEEKRLALLTELHELRRPPGGDDLCRARPQPAGDVAQVQGFVQAQSWFQDLTPVSVAP